MRPQILQIGEHQGRKHSKAVDQRSAIEYMTAVRAEEEWSRCQILLQAVSKSFRPLRMPRARNLVPVEEVAGEHPGVVIVEHGFRGGIAIPAFVAAGHRVQ